jgi:hypothetical protein
VTSELPSSLEETPGQAASAPETTANHAAVRAAQAADAATQAAKAAKFATDAQAVAKIKARIAEVVPNVENCSFCGTKSGYTLNIGVVQLKVNDFKNAAADAPTLSFPNAILVCQNCGNTVLLNLYVLGLPDLTGLTRSTNPPPLLRIEQPDN